MPIKGLTKDVKTTLRGGMTQFGSLRKGAPQETRKRKDGKEYNVVGGDLDYFRVDFQPQFAHMNEVFIGIYGHEPREFSNVILTADSVDGAFDSWMESWTGGTRILKQRCDGETRVLHYDFDKSRYDDTPLPCLQDSDTPCNCARSGRLYVILPDFCQAVSTLGYFTIHTGAIRDIAAIYNALTAASNMQVPLTRITWTIGRAMQNVAMTFEKDGQTKRKMEEQAVIYMTPDAQFVQRLISQAQSTGGVSSPAQIDGGVDIQLYGLPEKSSAPDDTIAEPEDPDQDDWDAELVHALEMLTGNSAEGVVRSLNGKKASGDLTEEQSVVEIFNLVNGWVSEAWAGRGTAAELLLDVNRPELRPFQVHAAVSEAVATFKDRGKPKPEQIGMVIDVLLDVVGYNDADDALAALDSVVFFLFREDTTSMSKRQLRGVQVWLCFTDETGEIVYPTSVLDELGAVLECTYALEALLQ